MAGGGSKAAVYAAIGANSFVTVAKFVGFFLTGSGSMLSEAIHSAADVGNQALLALGMARSKRPADEDHPFGYGLEAFVWSLISAVGIFFVGSGLSIMHAIEALLERFNPEAHGTHTVEQSWIGIGILVFALVIEGASLLVAVVGLMRDAKKRGMGLWKHVRTTDDPFGVAILAEDGAAVLGVIFALVAVGLTQYTGDPVWDALGTMAIGILLGAVAIFLIAKNRMFLLGKAISKKDRDIIRGLLEEDPAVEGIAVQKAIVRGTDRYRVSAEIELDGAYIAEKILEGRDLEATLARLDSADALRTFLAEYSDELMELTGDEIDRLEAKLREALPRAKEIALEPD